MKRHLEAVRRYYPSYGYTQEAPPEHKESLQDVEDMHLAVAYLSASLEAMEMTEPVRGVLNQILLMMNVMAHRMEATRYRAGMRSDGAYVPMAVPQRPQVREPASPDVATPIPMHSRLSQTEIKVLRYVGEGLSNEAISEALGMKKTSVATALNRAFGKLGARRRYHAYRLAFEAGLLN